MKQMRKGSKISHDPDRRRVSTEKRENTEIEENYYATDYFALNYPGFGAQIVEAFVCSITLPSLLLIDGTVCLSFESNVSGLT